MCVGARASVKLPDTYRNPSKNIVTPAVTCRRLPTPAMAGVGTSMFGIAPGFHPTLGLGLPPCLTPSEGFHRGNAGILGETVD